MDLTKRISARDKARTGKHYYKALRGYQQRKDILQVMYKSLDFNNLKLNKQKIRIIDLGCGPGIVGLYFHRKMKDVFKPKVTFVDINPLMLEAIHKEKDFHIVEQDITKLNMGSNIFDLALMKQVLDYLPKNLQIKTLKSTYKTLKNGGQFILSVLISPIEDMFNLNNYLYSEREKILNSKAPIKKFITTKEILLQWLSKIGFNDIKFHYQYDIPLSVKDFVTSFGLSRQQETKLKELYKRVIRKDRNNFYKSKIKDGDIELVEKGIIVSCYK